MADIDPSTVEWDDEPKKSIDPAGVKWDQPKKIDPATVDWDEVEPTSWWDRFKRGFSGSDKSSIGDIMAQGAQTETEAARSLGHGIVEPTLGAGRSLALGLGALAEMTPPSAAEFAPTLSTQPTESTQPLQDALFGGAQKMRELQEAIPQPRSGWETGARTATGLALGPLSLLGAGARGQDVIEAGGSVPSAQLATGIAGAQDVATLALPYLGKGAPLLARLLMQGAGGGGLEEAGRTMGNMFLPSNQQQGFSWPQLAMGVGAGLFGAFGEHGEPGRPPLEEGRAPPEPAATAGLSEVPTPTEPTAQPTPLETPPAPAEPPPAPTPPPEPAPPPEPPAPPPEAPPEAPPEPPPEPAPAPAPPEPAAPPVDAAARTAQANAAAARDQRIAELKNKKRRSFNDSVELRELEQAKADEAKGAPPAPPAAEAAPAPAEPVESAPPQAATPPVKEARTEPPPEGEVPSPAPEKPAAPKKAAPEPAVTELEEPGPKAKEPAPGPQPEDIGITKAETKAQREIYGMDELPEGEKRGWQDAAAAADAREAADPKYAEKRAAEIAAHGADGPNDIDLMAMLKDRVRLDKEFRDLSGKIDAARAAGDDTEAVRAGMARDEIEDKLDLNHRAIEKTKSAAGRTLAAAQARMTGDYTLSRNLTRLREASDGKVGKQSREVVEDASHAIEESHAREAEMQKKADAQAKGEKEPAKTIDEKKQAQLKARMQKYRDQIEARLKACPI
jgi:hypothetical protein